MINIDHDALGRGVRVRASELLHWSTTRADTLSRDELLAAHHLLVVGVGIALDGLEAIADQAKGPGAVFAGGIADAVRAHLGDQAPPQPQRARRTS